MIFEGKKLAVGDVNERKVGNAKHTKNKSVTLNTVGWTPYTDLILVLFLKTFFPFLFLTQVSIKNIYFFTNK